ncbi:ABC transporter ATP-binding protein [Halomicrobium salinisoli]|uniref:ABC transporter ATP-binding protein n=1 Tax=Halomicrobium salinisoli TaxID=2878391 RepID=UPI001CF035DD|nr:ABC transporter ATP-binding protein [Halomicrobium salinisoli]
MNQPQSIDDPIVEVEGVTKRYGSGEDALVAVDDVSFTIDRGSIVGLLGPNGAGKTTTIKMLLGLVIPTEGSVRIAGESAHDDSFAVYEHVAALFEGARNLYWRLTARENVRLFAHMHATHVTEDRIDDILETVGLRDRDDVQVRNLSRGMKQKAAIAAVLAKDTPIVFFDEPTLGLDLETSMAFRDELERLARELDKTLVVTSHDMDVIEAICDRAIVMQDGQVIADDAVENLLSAFDASAYRVTVEDVSPDLFEGDALAEFDVKSTERYDGARTATLTVQLERPDQLYWLLDVFRERGAVVTALEPVQVDLRDVFLRLTETVQATGGQPMEASRQ